MRFGGRRSSRTVLVAGPTLRIVALAAVFLAGPFVARLCGLPSAGLWPPAAAQSSSSPRPPVPPPPVDFDLGLDTRVREVTLHNLLDFGDDETIGGLASDTHFFRVRHRIWPQLRFRNGWRLYSRFTTEWRKYLDPYLTPKKTEIILDNLYFDMPKVPGLPLSARIGRQDIIRGEGFILLEGGPLDGSRSIYFNAIVLGLDGATVGLGKTRLELMGIRNPAWDDYIVANGWDDAARLHNQGRMVENDETAVGLYATNESWAEHKIEGYYFYKEEEPDFAADPTLAIHTIGARLAGPLRWKTAFAVEGAYQFGRHHPADAPDYDHRSFGGFGWLQRDFRLLFFRPAVKVGAIYLSGDDGEDRTDQGWVPLFSRWPMWSEMYIYSLVAERNRIADWSNLAALTAGASMQIDSRVSLSYAFYYLKAPHAHDPGKAPEPWRSGFFGTGTTRGHHHQVKLSAVMNRAISWHFLIERILPGDFYLPQDDAYFLRWELMLVK